MADSKIVKPAAKRTPPAAGKGRAKGSLNKTTKSAKEAIALAAEKLGGACRTEVLAEIMKAKDAAEAADLQAVERELCRRSLAHFAQRAWHVLEPAAELKWGWALDAICLHLEAVTMATSCACS
jgi:hypothetical protein